VAALLALASETPAHVRAALGLHPGARVLALATEGVTEPALWAEAVGA
jgi:hypothetical protein